MQIQGPVVDQILEASENILSIQTVEKIDTPLDIIQAELSMWARFEQQILP